ncbi:septum formation initiator [Solibacillus sp. R5-41]|uniref:DivIVA domain-containing protein n=1 Tax=Solibacillus sp. R5-41 TaxID=2048654 RepID=UPI000C129747|nr:DivIVA domain-containing protein [Solibacillus sp. R5-41]ATP39270.1 septum formation initiator [Solibacillus sp. R5-41]
MPLSPLDIHNKEFTRGFRGYAEDEVNEFLDQIIKDYEILLREKKELEEKVKSMADQMNHYSSLEETLQKSIVVAQEAADEVRRNSQKESKLIVKEAEKNADRIVNDAMAKARKVTIEIDELKKQSKVFRNRFKMLVEAQLDLLNTDDWEHLLEYDVGLTEIQEHNRPEASDEMLKEGKLTY